MQPMQVCILSDRPFQDTFENAQRTKLNKMEPMCSIFAVLGVWAQRKTAQSGPTSALSEIGLLLMQK